jgi:SNF2 family DNA or RNA helicase
MPERERLKGICKEKEYDIYVTTYDQFVAERGWFGGRVWRYVVVDEGTSPLDLLIRSLFEK